MRILDTLALIVKEYIIYCLLIPCIIMTIYLTMWYMFIPSSVLGLMALLFGAASFGLMHLAYKSWKSFRAPKQP